MIEYKTGDIFSAGTQAIVNTVNCVGVMGRGLALQFKQRFPDNFKAYAAACKQQAVNPGKMLVHTTSTATPQYIINFPTKRHWRNPSRIEDIETGLNDLVQVIRNQGITSIAIPPLGCGLGGLDWSEVRQKLEAALAGLTSVQVVLFEPLPAESTHLVPPITQQQPQMTPGRAALLVLIQRYLNGLLDPFVTLLEVHKLMYFMQEAGEPLRLNFVKHHYGPYAENLRHVLHTLEGHFIQGYGDGGDQPDKQLSLLPQAYEQAQAFLAHHDQTQRHFDRVVDLVAGFESPFGLELLATVHWVITKEQQSPQQAAAAVYNWNSHKQQFSPRQIDLVVDVLGRQGWLDTITGQGRA